MSSNEGNGKPSFHRPEPGEHVYDNSATGLGTAPTWLVPRRKGGGGGGGGGTGPAGPTGPPGSPGPAGPGVPVGGTTGQVLAKFSNADLDTFWETVVGGGIQFNTTNTGGWLLVRSNVVPPTGAGIDLRDHTPNGINIECETNGGLSLVTDGSGDISLYNSGSGTIDLVSQNGSIILQSRNGGILLDAAVSEDVQTLIRSGGRFNLQLSSGAQMILSGLVTSSPTSTTQVWRDTDGFVRIGPDPGTGGGGTGLAGFLTEEQGPMPGSLSSRGMYRVPFREAVSVTFTLDRASLHLETPGSTSSVLQVEKSSSAGVFTPVAVCSLTVAASNHQATDVTTGLGTLTSGDLVRFRWSALGTGANSYFVQLEGHE